MDSSNINEELVEVSVERFTALEELEKNLPDLIAKAIIDYKKENLRKLHEKDKNNPEAVRNRVKKYISKNRDKINEKRRERRKLLSEVNTEANTQTTLNNITNIPEDGPYEPSSGVTVRFND
jgi:gas vesicle protein